MAGWLFSSDYTRVIPCETKPKLHLFFLEIFVMSQSFDAEGATDIANFNSAEKNDYSLKLINLLFCFFFFIIRSYYDYNFKINKYSTFCKHQ